MRMIREPSQVRVGVITVEVVQEEEGVEVVDGGATNDTSEFDSGSIAGAGANDALLDVAEGGHGFLTRSRLIENGC